jgi:hypothetical protein
MSGKKGDIYLGELGFEYLLSPFGRRLIITPEEIGRKQRTASGRLVKDTVTTKHKFTLAYEAIDGTALETFLDLYELYDELSLLIYHSSAPGTTDDEGNYYDAYTVLMEPIARERLLLLSDGLWTGVSVVLEEV